MQWWRSVLIQTLYFVDSRLARGHARAARPRWIREHVVPLLGTWSGMSSFEYCHERHIRCHRWLSQSEIFSSCLFSRPCAVLAQLGATCTDYHRYRIYARRSKSISFSISVEPQKISEFVAKCWAKTALLWVWCFALVFRVLFVR